MKNVITFSVIAIWLGMATLLVRRQDPGAAVPLDPTAALLLAAESAEQEEWFGIYQQAGPSRPGGGPSDQKPQKIGHSHRAREKTGDGGLVYRDDSNFRLAMLGSLQDVRTSLTAHTDANHRLNEFDFLLVSSSTSFRAQGQVDGDVLRVTYGALGKHETLELPLDEDVHLPSTLRPGVLAQDAQPGDRYRAQVFSPFTMKKEPFVIEIEGRETIDTPNGPTDALRIREEHQGLAARAWLADDGSVLKEEATLGFTLVREPREVALAAAGTPTDLVIANRIPVDGAITAPRAATVLTVLMSGAASAKVPTALPRQTVEGDRLSIRRETLPTASVSLPLSESEAARLHTDLRASPFIESDDPAITGLARSVAGGATDATVVARRILAWVAENMTQEPSLTIPSAREVLRTRKGDCNEHAVLVAALARAAGLPARVVAGAVYGDGGFYYHAWNELWLGEWVSADAIFGQMPTDATHVKFLVGGPERHLGIAEMIGQLAFHTVETHS